MSRKSCVPPPSASIGMVQVPVHMSETETVDELLTRADELMYEEKKGKPSSRRQA